MTRPHRLLRGESVACLRARQAGGLLVTLLVARARFVLFGRRRKKVGTRCTLHDSQREKCIKYRKKRKKRGRGRTTGAMPSEEVRACAAFLASPRASTNSASRIQPQLFSRTCPRCAIRTAVGSVRTSSFSTDSRQP